MPFVYVVLRDTPEGCSHSVVAFPTQELADDYVAWMRGLAAVDPNYRVQRLPLQDKLP